MFDLPAHCVFNHFLEAISHVKSRNRRLNLQPNTLSCSDHDSLLPDFDGDFRQWICGPCLFMTRIPDEYVDNAVNMRSILANQQEEVRLIVSRMLLPRPAPPIFLILSMYVHL